MRSGSDERVILEISAKGHDLYFRDSKARFSTARFTLDNDGWDELDDSGGDILSWAIDVISSLDSADNEVGLDLADAVNMLMSEFSDEHGLEFNSLIHITLCETEYTDKTLARYRPTRDR